MRRFRLFLAAFALTLSTATFANTNLEFSFDYKVSPMSEQIENMLSDSGLIIEDQFTVTVIFKVNDQRKIEIRMIDSPNEEVNAFLKRRLENQKLYGKSWSTEKIYELPVKVQPTR